MRSSWPDAERFERFSDGLRLQHHAFTAAKGPVIHSPMPVMRKRSQIVYGHFDKAFGNGPAQDSILKETGKEAGKDGDDLEAHAALDDIAACSPRISVDESAQACPSGLPHRITRPTQPSTVPHLCTFFCREGGKPKSQSAVFPGTFKSTKPSGSAISTRLAVRSMRRR